MSILVNEIARVKANLQMLRETNSIDAVVQHRRGVLQDALDVIDGMSRHITGLTTNNNELLARYDAIKATNKANTAELQKARDEITHLVDEKNTLIAAMGATSDPEPAPEVHTITIRVIGDLPAPLRMMLEAFQVTE